MARLFIAIETPPGVAAELLRTLPSTRGIRTVPAEQIHLTLHFLGERDDEMAARIEDVLASVRAEPMTLTVAGAGRFRGSQGSVLWAGLCATPALPMPPEPPDLPDPLHVLYEEIGRALESLGITPERRRFHPHLTLARCRPGVPEAVLREWLSGHRALPPRAWQAVRFVLYESHLDHRGARHECRRVYTLAAPE